MSFQKCPICNGSGYAFNQIVCRICNGKGIINEQTGKPPENRPININKTEEDSKNP